MKTIFRIANNILILISVLNGYWILAFIFGIFGLWKFHNYFEIIIAGIIFDSLFGFTSSLGIMGYIGSIVSFSMFIISLWLHRILRR